MKGIDLILIKNQLRGASFKKLLKSKKSNKYRVAKACGITYRTLCNWQTDKTKPSDENSIIVGRFLGLIKPTETEKIKLQQDINKLQEKLNRID